MRAARVWVSTFAIALLVTGAALSECVPPNKADYVAPVVTVFSGAVGLDPRYVVLSNGEIFWTAHTDTAGKGSIWKGNPDIADSGVQIAFAVQPGGKPEHIAVDDQFVYWTEEVADAGASGGISFVARQGGDPTALATPDGSVASHSVAIASVSSDAGSALYWANPTGSAFERAPGGQVSMLPVDAGPGVSAWAIAGANNDAVVAFSSSNEVWTFPSTFPANRVALDGVLCAGENDPYKYFIGALDGSVELLRAKGTLDATVFALPNAAPLDLVTDHTPCAWWTQRDVSSIGTLCGFDDASVGTVRAPAAALNGVQGLAVDATHLCWSARDASGATASRIVCMLR